MEFPIFNYANNLLITLNIPQATFRTVCIPQSPQHGDVMLTSTARSQHWVAIFPNTVFALSGTLPFLLPLGFDDGGYFALINAS